MLATFAVLSAWQPRYDISDPNYDRLAYQFQRLNAQDDSASPRIESQIDLSMVNGGQWTKICIFGPYMSPIDTMFRERMLLAPTDYLRIAGLIAHFPFRISLVEEREAMLIYVDLRGITHVLHFERDLPDWPHWSDCIGKPQTIMDL
jgi:hypothetical protein